MTLKQLTEALEISTYPEELEAYHPLPEERRGELCTPELICRLQERFSFFGEYYDAVLLAFKDLENDLLRAQYLHAASLFLKDADTETARTLPFPKEVGTPASRMLPLFIHLPSIEGLYDLWKKRGLSEELTLSTLSAYRTYIRETKEHRAGYIGLTRGSASWLCYFTKGEIFYPGHRGLNFQLRRLVTKSSPFILRHKKSGVLIPVFGNEIPFQKDGLLYIKSYHQDPEFFAEFEETADAFIGNPTENCRILKERRRFPKEEWELALRPGDPILACHIFFDTDFSPENLDRSFQEAKKVARQCFPELGLTAFFCGSWLLNPHINEILGESAKLSLFSSRFTRYPLRRNGSSVYTYVFRGYDPQKPALLPEDTTLQRGLKARLLQETPIFETAGIFFFE